MFLANLKNISFLEKNFWRSQPFSSFFKKYYSIKKKKGKQNKNWKIYYF
jgi:hypothetical protein